MGTRHGFLSILISFLLVGLWPASGLAQEEPGEKEEKPASEKPEEPASESDEKQEKKSGDEGEKEEADDSSESEESETEAPPEPPEKEFHPSGLPKPPSHFSVEESEAKVEDTPRYRSGLPKPPAPGQDSETDSETKTEPAAPAPRTEQPEPDEPLSIAERIRRLTERRLGRRPLAAPSESSARPDGLSPGDARRAAPQLEELVRHVRVHILLRNGQTFEGIIKDQQVIEDLKAGRVALGSEARSSGRGFRLWYVYETEGYVRIGFDQIREIKVLRTLTPKEVTSMQDRLAAQRQETMTEEMERRRIRDARLALRKAEKAAEAAAEVAREAVGEAEESIERVARYQELLEQFPPEDGWSPERKEEIERRKITIDVFPNEKEQAFLDGYEEWLPVYHWWVEEQKKKAEEDEPAPAEEKPDAEKKTAEKPEPTEKPTEKPAPTEEPTEKPAPKEGGDN